jgi:NADH kinase
MLTGIETPSSDLLSLQWPAPPRNILMIKKEGAPAVTESLIEYAKSVFYPN